MLVLTESIACIPCYGSKTNLGIPSVRAVVVSSDFVDKMWLEGVKPIVNVGLGLNTLLLSLQKLFNVSHEVGTLGTGMADQPTFCANFMESLISALDPYPLTIVHS